MRLTTLALGLSLLLAACAPGSFTNPLGVSLRIPVIVGEHEGAIVVGADGSITGEGVVQVEGEAVHVVTVPR